MQKLKETISPWRRRLGWPGCLVTIAALLLVGLFINDRYLFESVHVPSSSMRPTLLPGDRGYLKIFGVGPIHRFDVVVLQGAAAGTRLVKRVIGLPGDHVRLEESWRVRINGQLLNYAPSAQPDEWIEAGKHLIQTHKNPKFDFPTVFGKDELELGPGEYYVLGDNRLASEDSRTFGPIKSSDIQGRLLLVWWSWDSPAGHIRWDRLLTWVR